MSNKITIEDVYRLLKETKTDFSRQFKSISEKLESLSAEVHEKFSETNQRLERLETENARLAYHLKIAEKKLKGNNLIFHGVEESTDETSAKLIDAIKRILKDHLEVNINTFDITNIFRLGKKSGGKPKPVLVSFLSKLTKTEITKNRRKLKGTKIFMNEDLEREELEILLTYRKEAKQKKQKAIIRGSKLEIDGRLYTIEQLQTGSHILEEEPVILSHQTQSHSEPTTPLPRGEIERYLEDSDGEEVKDNKQREEIKSKNFSSKEIEDTQQELKNRPGQLQKEPKPISQTPLKTQINTRTRNRKNSVKKDS